MMQHAGKQGALEFHGIDKFIPLEENDKEYTNEKWLAGLAIFPPTEHYRKKELTKFFEYMNAGLPIISSDFPVWKEFMDTYECGIAVDPNNDDEIKQRSEEHTSELQSRGHLVCRLLLEKTKRDR